MYIAECFLAKRIPHPLSFVLDLVKCQFAGHLEHVHGDILLMLDDILKLKDTKLDNCLKFDELK
jgi:ATP/maltotriose-dependent transcriptional regulator MalT